MNTTAEGKGRAECRLCRQYPRFNAKTVAAIREADADYEHYVKTGSHKLATFNSLSSLFASWK